MTSRNAPTPAPGLPSRCFAVHPSGELIQIVRGEGVVMAPLDCLDGKSPRQTAAMLNEAGGITKAQAAAMLAGALYGWDDPRAFPENYSNKGRYRRPAKKGRDR